LYSLLGVNVEHLLAAGFSFCQPSQGRRFQFQPHWAVQRLSWARSGRCEVETDGLRQPRSWTPPVLLCSSSIVRAASNLADGSPLNGTDASPEEFSDTGEGHRRALRFSG
jgi:hypothetical protein